MLLSWVVLLWSSISLHACPVEPVLVTDQTIRIKGEQRFFYALEEGDELTLVVASTNGKNIRRVDARMHEGDEVWSSSKMAAQLEGSWNVVKRAVYEVRIQAGAPKTVRFQLYRRPKTLSRTIFDTQVQWKTVIDTIRRSYWSKTEIVYDTSYPTHYRRVHYQTAEETYALVDRVERVHSKTHLQGENSSTLTFLLPKLQSNGRREERLVGVAYWLGVGQEGLENYKAELKKFLGSVAIQAGKKNMLAGVAVGAYAVATNPPQGDNIHYTWRNNAGTALGKGNVTTAFGRFTGLSGNQLTLTLTNDNILNGLNIHLKLVAVVERRYYRQEGYQVRTITPLKLEQTRGKVRLVQRQVPVINNW